MDQVELVVPCPILSDVIHLKYAVGRNPILRWRIEVNPVDSN